MSPLRPAVFRDRAEAGRLLAAKLEPYKDQAPVILALPRGGVPVAFEVARALGAPLDIVVARKLGAPGDPELAVGAVVDGEEPVCVLNDALIAALGVSRDYLDEETAAQLQEVRRREAVYRGGRPPAAVAGRVVIIIDDGIATGASMRAAVRGVRRRRAGRIVVAAPAAPAEILDELKREADDVAVLEEPKPFVSVGACYADFSQTGDEEVVRLLESIGGK